MRPVFPGATEKSQISHLPELLPLFERADCTAVKTAKAKEEDRTKIDPLEKSYVSTETGQVQRAFQPPHSLGGCSDYYRLERHLPGGVRTC